MVAVTRPLPTYSPTDFRTPEHQGYNQEYYSQPHASENQVVSSLAAVGLLLISVVCGGDVDFCTRVDAWLWTFVVVKSLA